MAVSQYLVRINHEITAKIISDQTFYDVNPAKYRHPEWDTEQNTPAQTLKEVPVVFHT